MDGILIVDKPEGPTSFDVVKRLRRLGRERKAGHTGTLDPMATGVLPLCLGNATKLSALLVDADKEYEGVVRFGIETDTYDGTGEVVREADASSLEQEAVEAAVLAMQGEYWQTPPMYSAVKVGGRRLYELARKGEEVERRPRKVRVEKIELRSWDPARAEATIFAHVSKGTYMRSIAHELGEALAVGGHLASLRRLRSGPFSIERALPLATLLEWLSLGEEAAIAAAVVPMREALPELPEVLLDEARDRKVSHGMALGSRDLVELGAPRLQEGEKVRLIGVGGELLAVAQVQQGRMRYVRVLAGGRSRPEQRPNGR